MTASAAALCFLLILLVTTAIVLFEVMRTIFIPGTAARVSGNANPPTKLGVIRLIQVKPTTDEEDREGGGFRNFRPNLSKLINSLQSQYGGGTTTTAPSSKNETDSTALPDMISATTRKRRRKKPKKPSKIDGPTTSSSMKTMSP